MKNTFHSIVLAVGFCTFFACTDQPTPPFVEDVDISANTEIIEITDSIIVNSFEIERVLSAHLQRQNQNLSLSRSIDREFVETPNGNPAYHIVNLPNNNGWVIISASKEFWPVIAYSTEGTFDISNMPPGLQAWNDDLCTLMDNPRLLLEEHKKDMHNLWTAYEKGDIPTVASRSPGYEPIDPADYSIISKIIMDSVSSWNAKGYEVYQLDSNLYNKYPEIYEEFDDLARFSTWVEYELAYKDVSYVILKTESYEFGPGHMINSYWHQEYPFNRAYPTIPTSYGGIMTAHAGCVPVAVGQVMFYHKYPQSINWGEMSPTYGTLTTSQFLYELAEKMNATYKETGTGAKMDNAAKVLKSYGYNASCDDFDSSKIMSSLSAGRPVVCSSTLTYSDKTTSKHAWVIGGWHSSSTNYIFQLWGCKDKRRFSDMGATMRNSSSARYYSINWGWGSGSEYYIDFSTACPSNYLSSKPVEAITDIYPIK